MQLSRLKSIRLLLSSNRNQRARVGPQSLSCSRRQYMMADALLSNSIRAVQQFITHSTCFHPALMFNVLRSRRVVASDTGEKHGDAEIQSFSRGALEGLLQALHECCK
jgi:uncharacterized protein YcaQ